jgi:hypothetical protein
MLKSLRIMRTNFPACMIQAHHVGVMWKGKSVGQSFRTWLSKAVPCEGAYVVHMWCTGVTALPLTFFNKWRICRFRILRGAEWLEMGAEI